MAVNKRKVLDAARKYAQKGAKEKALKEYHTLLKLDPRDAKLHLEIGDCYRRWGQIDEAVTQYARVADQYKGDGFDARAVAVFKQILNLDPKRYTAYVSLAELYQRMGLDAEALSSLQAAADGYHKEGQKREALDLLRRMATLDPTNTTSRLKVAELLRQEGMLDDALSEYEAVGVELAKQGATESFISLQERILELRPDRVDVRVAIARALIELRKPERAEPFARQALDKDPNNTDIYELLCDIYKSLGNEKELAETTRLLAQVYRDRGDDDKARALAQRIPAAFQLAAEEKRTVDETESAFLSDDELLDEDFLASDPSDVGAVRAPAASEPEELELEDESDELLLDEEPADSGEREDDSAKSRSVAATPGPAPQGDPEQLFAEASVYLRYGRREQAIASLRAVLDQEPEHRAALEKLGEAYAEGEETGEAVAFWCRAARLAQREHDGDAFEVLRDRIHALDPDAASDLGPAVRSALADEPEPERLGVRAEDTRPELESGDASGFDIDVELDLGADADGPVAADSGEDPFDVSGSDGAAEPQTDRADPGDSLAAALEAAAAAVPEPEDARDAARGSGLDLDEIEIDIDVDEPGDAASSPEVAKPRATDRDADSDGADGSLDLDAESSGSAPRGKAVADKAAAPAPRKSAPSTPEDSGASSGGTSNGTSNADRVAEDLEEAEFYFQQGLFKEAEPIYRRVLKLAPRHPSALLRLGELAAAKDDEESPVAAQPAVSARSGDADDDSTEVADPASAPEAGEPVVQMDTPPAKRPRLGDDEDGSTEDTTVEFPALESSDAAAAQSKTAAGENEGLFDLAAELRDVIEDERTESASPGASAPSTIDDGFDSIFADFKQGVSATLSEDDYETRYDLGIAYREMELYADAIGEFQRCLKCPRRKITSLHMMGLCALDLGQAQDAANHFQQALASDELPQSQAPGIQFDLGRALEACGDVARACTAYRAVLDDEPDFPGVAERLAALESGDATPALGGARQAAGFESFDDLVADANGGDEDEETVEAPEETFESFDDVLMEAAGESEAEYVTDEPEVPDEPAEPEEPEEEEPKPKTRRKKISFV